MDNPEKRPRALPGEVELRARVVMGLLAEGCSRGEIRVHAAATWGVGEGTADRYIRDARELLRLHSMARRSELLGLSIERHRRLYKAAISNGDLELALRVQTGLDKLLGLDKPVTVDDVIKLIALEQKLEHAAGNPAPASLPGAPTETALEPPADPRAKLRLLAEGGG